MLPVFRLCCLAVGGSLLFAGERISPRAFLEDVKHLSSPDLKGRGAGSPGLDKAAAYLASQFQKAGLRPLGNSFLQPFPITVSAQLGPANAFHWSAAGESHKLQLHKDFIPLNFSGNGAMRGGVVFAGYGITAPEYGYDDYAGIDAKDRIVLLLRHEPQEFDSDSLFEGRIYTEHSQLFSKAVNARLHGARAVLYVSDTAAHSNDAMEPFVGFPGPGDPGIPFVQIDAAVVEQWFHFADRSFHAVQEKIGRDLRPQPFAFPPGLLVDATVDVKRTSRDVNNVVAYLPGATGEHVVVGAHYDHLGLGEQYSLATSAAGVIHPGADDNASGAAGLLSLARRLASQPKLKRGVVFIAFAGEELGLLGSGHYAAHPLLPIREAVAMINMDMIGRVQDGRVVVSGAPTGSSLEAIVNRAAKRYPFKLDLNERGVYGSSDHTSFMARMVPVLFFFTGLHEDYHKPADTWEKLNAAGTASLLELIADVATDLAEGSRPLWVSPASRTPPAQ